MRAHTNLHDIVVLVGAPIERALHDPHGEVRVRGKEAGQQVERKLVHNSPLGRHDRVSKSGARGDTEAVEVAKDRSRQQHLKNERLVRRRPG